MTDDGWRLAVAGREGGRTITATGLPLSVREISLLRTVVVENEALNASFFSLFRGPDRRLPLDEGEPVEIAINQDARDVPDRKRRTQSRVLRGAFYEPMSLDTVSTQAVIWGLRQWCRDLSILDELVTATRPSVSEDAVQKISPIKATADWPDQHDSRARLLEHFWGVTEHVANYWVASVPESLWSFCPREHLPVARAKDLLSDWLAMNRAATFTRVFAPSTAMPRWTRRGGDYDALVDGYLRTARGYASHVGILDQALEKGGFFFPPAWTMNASGRGVAR